MVLLLSLKIVFLKIRFHFCVIFKKKIVYVSSGQNIYNDMDFIILVLYYYFIVILYHR